MTFSRSSSAERRGRYAYKLQPPPQMQKRPGKPINYKGTSVERRDPGMSINWSPLLREEAR